MASRDVEPKQVASKTPAGPPGGSEEPDRKDFTATGAEKGGTMDVDTMLREHHAVSVSIKGVAILQKMETRELGGGGGGGGSEVLGSKAAPTPASLAAKVQSAASTTGVFVTQSADEMCVYVSISIRALLAFEYHGSTQYPIIHTVRQGQGGGGGGRDPRPL